MAELSKNDLVRDRSQRTGYPTIYRVEKLEGDRALVSRIGEINAGRYVNMSRAREESYRLVANLVREA